MEENERTAQGQGFTFWLGAGTISQIPGLRNFIDWMLELIYKSLNLVSISFYS